MTAAIRQDARAELMQDLDGELWREIATQTKGRTLAGALASALGGRFDRLPMSAAQDTTALRIEADRRTWNIGITLVPDGATLPVESLDAPVREDGEPRAIPSPAPTPEVSLREKRLADRITHLRRTDPDLDRMLAALADADGNKSAAARTLGMNEIDVRRRLTRLKRQLAE